MAAATTPDCNFYEDSLEEWGIPRILLAEDKRTGDLYYPLKPLIEALAVDRGTTVALAKNDSRTASWVKTIKVPTAGGPQPTDYIRRKELAILLTIIDPNRIGPRARARGKLEEFQAALWRLGDKIAFRHKRVADTHSTPVSTTAALEGTQTGYAPCPVCDSPLEVEVSQGHVHLKEQVN